MSITIHRGSILDSKADCIVNAANGHLRHGGGLARVIDQAAQTMPDYGPLGKRIPGPIAPETTHPELAAIHRYREDHKAAPLIATGNVHVTSAGVLPFKGIIHAVGPIWNGGEFAEERLLRQAYRNACRAALAHDWTSIAFPAISAGIFGYPPDEVARVAVEAVRVFSGPGWDLDIEFWPFGYEELFEKMLDLELAR